MQEEIIVPVVLFGGTAVVLWKFFEGRHKERMAMIEKGVSPAEFKSPSSTPFRLWQGTVLSNLKWGLLFVFSGIGLLVGQQLEYYFGFHEDSAVFGSILITGGLALIIFYFIASKKLKEKKDDEG
jgi:4-amino-4-deoxy-L-arabinose transferase-like glycosyltransferase